MTAKYQKPLVLVIASLLATTAAIAQQAEPSPAPPAVTPAPPPAAEQGAQPALPAIPPQPKKDQEAAANEVLNKSPAPASNCYSGFHTSFDYDITGSALTALGRKVIEPGGLCDQYREYSADMPIEIGVPLLPGVSVNIDKLCKMVQRPPCPEPPGSTLKTRIKRKSEPANVIPEAATARYPGSQKSRRFNCYDPG